MKRYLLVAGLLTLLTASATAQTEGYAYTEQLDDDLTIPEDGKALVVTDISPEDTATVKLLSNGSTAQTFEDKSLSGSGIVLSNITASEVDQIAINPDNGLIQDLKKVNFYYNLTSSPENSPIAYESNNLFNVVGTPPAYNLINADSTDSLDNWFNQVNNASIVNDSIEFDGNSVNLTTQEFNAESHSRFTVNGVNLSDSLMAEVKTSNGNDTQSLTFDVSDGKEMDVSTLPYEKTTINLYGDADGEIQSIQYTGSLPQNTITGALTGSATGFLDSILNSISNVFGGFLDSITGIFDNLVGAVLP